MQREQDDFLAHYGVLGMKWGVRKKRVSSGSSKSKKSGINNVDKINSKYDVKKYGSKKNAIKKISNNAEIARKARTLVKKGAGALTSSAALTQALNIAWASGIQTGAAAAGKTILAVGAVSNPALTVPIAALGVGAAVYASKAKGKTSKSSKKRIQNIKKYT